MMIRIKRKGPDGEHHEAEYPQVDTFTLVEACAANGFNAGYSIRHENGAFTSGKLGDTDDVEIVRSEDMGEGWDDNPQYPDKQSCLLAMAAQVPELVEKLGDMVDVEIVRNEED